jgi:formamidopyrimidine-DNA glycosylase
MPELPEVRTVAKVLRENLLNKKVTKIEIIYPKIIESDSLDLNLLVNKNLKDINTYGKYLIFDFDEYYLLSHLRMEGKYNLKKITDPIVKHEHVIFEFDNTISVRYTDTRKFGRMLLITKDKLHDNKFLNKLGLEPFSKDINADYLLGKLKNKKKPIKELLLDQTIMTGLGNIYVDEVLFASRINPLKNGSDLTSVDCTNIINNAVSILNKAILNGGTTIRSYTSSLGVTGHYQDYLMVHKRSNEPCKICNTKINKIKVGGRSTYFCPNCQK